MEQKENPSVTPGEWEQKGFVEVTCPDWDQFSVYNEMVLLSSIMSVFAIWR